jgi:4-amino-4-deoxy-L-arabinose transferase-like glycosyltransferase
MKSNWIKFIAKNKIVIILALITILGATLRLYNFHNLVRFSDDQSRDSMVVDDMFFKHDFPLLGPYAGGTTFNLGPAYYYMEALSALIFGNTPAGLATFVVILSIATIPLLFWLLRNYFTNYISLFLAFLYAVSFYAIKYSKFTWNINVIPFFMVIFFILMLKTFEKKEGKSWPLYLGIGFILGILVQLHTMLIVFAPAVFGTVFLYQYFFMKKGSLLNFLVVILAILVLNSTIFVYEYQNNGENFKSFLSATEKKTGKNGSFSDSFLKSGQFMVQQYVYVPSGFEPQKNWIQIRKFLKKRNWPEILAALLGTALFISSLSYSFRLFRSENNEKKKAFLWLMMATLFISFILFIPLANMLKSRFFIIIFFIPFVFLGIVIKYILSVLEKRTAYLIIFIGILILTFLNLKVYAKAYDTNEYSGKSDIYGGIMLKEVEDMSNFAVSFSKNNGWRDRKIYVGYFKFAQSVNYLNKRAGLNSEIFRKSDKMDPGSILFLVTKSKNGNKIFKRYDCFYNLLKLENIGRFDILALEKKNLENEK